MNVALPRTRAGHRGPYFAGMIAGFAALTVAAIAGVWQLTGSDDGVATTPPAVRSTANVAPAPRPLTLYVVGTDEQAALMTQNIQAADNELFINGIFDSGETVLVMKASNLEEEMSVTEFAENWMGIGATVRILDVRGDLAP
jgi:hypothetical protein